MNYGDPDSHGRYGILDDDGQTVLCHECGTRRAFLGRHIRVHDLTADEYREAHGLGRSTPLAAQGLRETMSENASARVGSPQWERFEAARDVDAAREASRQVAAQGDRPQAARSHREQALKASQARGLQPGVCTVEGCGRRHVAQGWCRTHYERWKRTGDVQADVPVRPRKGGPRT